MPPPAPLPVRPRRPAQTPPALRRDRIAPMEGKHLTPRGSCSRHQYQANDRRVDYGSADAPIHPTRRCQSRHLKFSQSARHRDKPEGTFTPVNRGATLLGVLISLAMIGVLAAAIPLLTSGDGTTSSETPSTLLPANEGPSGNAVPNGASGAINASTIVACRNTFQAAEAAIEEWQVEHGSPPTSTSELQRALRDPLSSTGYTIEVDPWHLGVLGVLTRTHPFTDGPGNCAFAG